MSREIRRTPVGWWPPLFNAPYGQNQPYPQHDMSIEEARAAGHGINDPDAYHPAWTDEERDGYQLYETVSEGTPLTPSFATKAELVNYLVTVGPRNDGTLTRPQAEGIVNDEWAPSGSITPGSGPIDSYGRPASSVAGIFQGPHGASHLTWFDR